MRMYRDRLGRCSTDFKNVRIIPPGGFVQTLAAAYPKSLAPKAVELLKQEHMGLRHLLEAANFRRVSAAELPDLDSIRGFNTPEEYRAAVRNEK